MAHSISGPRSEKASCTDDHAHRRRPVVKKISILFTSLAVVLAFGIVATAATASATSSLKATTANLDFRGVWNGGTWIIRTENFSTGVCTGTTDYGKGYALTDCVVTGNSYVLTITDTTTGATSPWYYSHNSGTIAGNTANGSWSDTNGSGGNVSFSRSPSVSSTTITAKPTKVKKGASVRYSVHVTSGFGLPNGEVRVKVGKTLLGTIKLSQGAGSLRTTKTPQGKHEVVTASYAGSKLPPFKTSRGSTRVTVAK